MEDVLQSVKASLEYAHAQVVDLKKDNEAQKEMGKEMKKTVESLERENALLHNSIVDLKARSLRDNLTFQFRKSQTMQIGLNVSYYSPKT